MKHSLFALLLALMVTACGTDPCGTDKDAFLNDYYKLLGEAKTANWPVSDDRWDTYDERFRAYVEECYDLHEPEMSGREKRRFWRQSLSYFTVDYGVIEGNNSITPKIFITHKVSKFIKIVLFHPLNKIYALIIHRKYNNCGTLLKHANHF